VLAGSDFSFAGSVQTANGGVFHITNSGSLTFASAMALNIDGAIIQDGSGNVSGGGTWTTNNQSIHFASPLTLTGNLSVNSGTGDAIFDNQISGAYNFTVEAGNVFLNGIGTAGTGIGAMNITAIGSVHLLGSLYHALSQTYAAGSQIDFEAGVPVSVINDGGTLAFNEGTIQLSAGTDLEINTHGGAFNFVSLQGTGVENVSIDTGIGTTLLGSVDSLNNLTVSAGSILFNGAISIQEGSWTSLTSILNSTGPVLISLAHNGTFLAYEGNVGSLANPIQVNSLGLIYAGASTQFNSLAAFTGSTSDNTIHALSSSPPCKIVFNGNVIKNCEQPIPPVPPVPHRIPRISCFYCEIIRSGDLIIKYGIAGAGIDRKISC